MFFCFLFLFLLSRTIDGLNGVERCSQKSKLWRWTLDRRYSEWIDLVKRETERRTKRQGVLRLHSLRVFLPSFDRSGQNSLLLALRNKREISPIQSTRDIHLLESKPLAGTHTPIRNFASRFASSHPPSLKYVSPQLFCHTQPNQDCSFTGI